MYGFPKYYPQHNVLFSYHLQFSVIDNLQMNMLPHIPRNTYYLFKPVELIYVSDVSDCEHASCLGPGQMHMCH